MGDGAVLKVLCGRPRRPHIIGRVYPVSGGGLELRYKDAVRVAATGRDPEDFEAHDSTYRIDEPTGYGATFDAYCASCRARFIVHPAMLIDAVTRSLSTFALQGMNPEARYLRRVTRDPSG